MASKEEILDALKKVSFPGFDKDIVTLGAVEDVAVEGDSVTVSLKTISAADDILAHLNNQVRDAVAVAAGKVSVTVAMGGKEMGPQSKPHAHTHEQEDPFVRKGLPGVKHVVPVTSGKGGVGKSTVAVNLAFSLSALGHKVGILDLDIYGPSVHKMIGAKERLAVVDDMIAPAELKGLKAISIGMAVEDSEALIMRGPMVMKVLDQLINQVNWGELDYLIVDLPPGTGDVPLSLVQQLAIDGAIVVTTPQDVALADVRRAVTMFGQTKTHMLGIVENMSYYVCQNCGDKAHIFGHGGGEKESAALGIPLLAQIPLTKSICDQADLGSPIIDHEASPEIGKVFEDLAKAVIKGVEEAPDPAIGSPQERASGHRA